MRYFITLLLLLPFILFAQTFQLSGTIVNGADDKPVEGASIFINSASGGTVSGKDGLFTLSNIALNKFDLVVSHISFETLVVPVTPENMGRRFKIQLAPKEAELENVIVAPIEKNGWEKWGRVFTRTFIGTSEVAQNCIIKNPEVLRFRYNQNTSVLRVTGSDRLIIENKKLGYIIGFQLEELVYDRKEGMSSYVGYTSFTPMQSSRKRKEEGWQKARLEAYNGSMMHFMRSIYANTTAADGFEMRTLRRLYKGDTATRALYDSLMRGRSAGIDTARYAVQVMRPSNHLQPPIVYIIGKNLLPADSIRKWDSVKNAVSLYFPDDLMVRYKNETEKQEYVLQKSGLTMKPQAQRSIIYFVNPQPVIVEKSGLYFNPLNVFTEDYWAWEKTAEMLPADYQPGD